MRHINGRCIQTFRFSSFEILYGCSVYTTPRLQIQQLEIHTLKTALENGSFDLPDEELLVDLVANHIARYEKIARKVRVKDEVMAMTRKRNHDLRVPSFQKEDLVFLIQEGKSFKPEPRLKGLFVIESRVGRSSF
jgi:hypothetical protein